MKRDVYPWGSHVAVLRQAAMHMRESKFYDQV